MKERDYITTMPIPEAVDLGLPSGLKWASFNLGASKPEEYGYYYGMCSTYSHKIGGTRNLLDYCGSDKDPLKDYIDPNDKSILEVDTKWDAARQELGGAWRMPTFEEIKELDSTDNCDWQWMTENGVDGYKVTSKKNGNSIFLPAAGYRGGTSLYGSGSDRIYWSLSPRPYSSDRACYLDFNSGHFVWFTKLDCCDGFTVRPVSE